jgi:hypothetical protein
MWIKEIAGAKGLRSGTGNLFYLNSQGQAVYKQSIKPGSLLAYPPVHKPGMFSAPPIHSCG